ncbi:hypothetical protein H9P43_006955 [Blastocladiella emersonii ATCC 22665]|nr:hypothetical protein H9P43_006955 [Blastocladiella emersonii ATCC 22665]
MAAIDTDPNEGADLDADVKSLLPHAAQVLLHILQHARNLIPAAPPRVRVKVLRLATATLERAPAHLLAQQNNTLNNFKWVAMEGPQVYQMLILARHSQLLDGTDTTIDCLVDGQRRVVEPRIILMFDYESEHGTLLAFNDVFSYHLQRQPNGPRDDLGYVKLTRSAVSIPSSAAAVELAAHAVPAFSATSSA